MDIYKFRNVGNAVSSECRLTIYLSGSKLEVESSRISTGGMGGRITKSVFTIGPRFKSDSSSADRSSIFSHDYVHGESTRCGRRVRNRIVVETFDGDVSRVIV